MVSVLFIMVFFITYYTHGGVWRFWDSLHTNSQTKCTSMSIFKKFFLLNVCMFINKVCQVPFFLFLRRFIFTFKYLNAVYTHTNRWINIQFNFSGGTLPHFRNSVKQSAYKSSDAARLKHKPKKRLINHPWKSTESVYEILKNKQLADSTLCAAHHSCLLVSILITVLLNQLYTLKVNQKKN